MPGEKKRPKAVVHAALTADGKLDGAISGIGKNELRRLLADGQIEELCLTIRPKIDGRRGAETLSGQNGDFFPASIPLRLLRLEVQGEECLLYYRIKRQTRKRRAATE